MTFHHAYRDLEGRFRALAETDGDVYLPNVEPPGRVAYVFIAMEPSLGRWARSPHEARAKVAAGFRNFVADEVGDDHIAVLRFELLRGVVAEVFGFGRETDQEAVASLLP